MLPGYLQKSARGRDWVFEQGQVRDVAAEQRGQGLGAQGLKSPLMHALLEMGRV